MMTVVHSILGFAIDAVFWISAFMFGLKVVYNAGLGVLAVQKAKKFGEGASVSLEGGFELIPITGLVVTSAMGADSGGWSTWAIGVWAVAVTIVSYMVGIAGLCVMGWSWGWNKRRNTIE